LFANKHIIECHLRFQGFVSVSPLVMSPWMDAHLSTVTSPRQP